ncbi:MAG: hypothetical protein JO217_14080 [Acidobacteriaceae bacterium]|nr:hypothetical protein [Acidobacteriaceae bacterium]
MAQLGEAIARYHKLLQGPGYRNLSWAAEFQEQMRGCGLTESGRLISPVLRPQFISRRQLDTLTRTAEHLAAIVDQVEALALTSPALLNRLQMLPAEKMLAAIPSGYSRFSVTSRMDAHLENGSVCLRGLDTCKPRGLAYADVLSDLFLDLPIVKTFKRGRYRLSKVGGGVKRLHAAVLQAWKEFGGRRPPNIAIVEFGDPFGTRSTEGPLLADRFVENGSPTRIVSPEQLEYRDNKLRVGDFEIDVVFRRLLTRELLAHFDLSHPLLAAYRDRAVCVVNNFRSELGQRRALFDLVTDDAVIAQLPTPDRKLIRHVVPWTRVVVPKKTKYKDRVVDLPEFILRTREELILRPNEDSDGQRVFVGAEMTQSAWEHALRIALRAPYVVQERLCSSRQKVPVFQYGELQMKEVEISIHPHVFNGKMHGASAALETSSAGCASPLAIAPVLLLEES